MIESLKDKRKSPRYDEIRAEILKRVAFQIIQPLIQFSGRFENRSHKTLI